VTEPPAGHPPRRFPILTVIALTATAAVTATRLWTPDVMHALWRDPDELGAGQIWRLLSPVLVQSDGSASLVLAVFALCGVIGVLGERVFPPRRWIALYLLGALVGHGIGEVFQPDGGGTSVAFMGILGGLAAYALRSEARVPTPVRVEAALAIPLAVIDTVLRDIHGLPFLAGLVTARIWLWRD
jgi:rhomboid protease GluP